MRATSGSRAERPPLTLVVVAAAFFGLAVPRAATAVQIPSYCDNLGFYWYDMSQCQAVSGAWNCPYYWAWCDGRKQFIAWELRSDWSYWENAHPELFDLNLGCNLAKQTYGQPPAEVCGNDIDENCDGIFSTPTRRSP